MHMTTELHTRIKGWRLSGMSDKFIANELGISRRSAQMKIASVQSSMTQDELAQVTSASSLNRRRNISLANGGTGTPKAPPSYSLVLGQDLADVYTSSRATLTSMCPDHPVKTGQVAEDFAKYALRRAGFDYLTPSGLDFALDLVISSKSGRLLRSEVKGFRESAASLVRSTSTLATHRPQRYTEADNIDIFLIVDLINELMFVIPASELLNHRSVRPTPNSQWWKYLWRFDLLN